MRRLLVLLALVLLGGAAPAAAEPVPAGYEFTDEWFESADGTRMHAGVFLPADRKPGERHPVIMVIGPYTAPNGGATAPGNVSGPVIRFPELFTDAKILKDRWAYVQVDARGFGGSGGCFEYYGKNEFADAKASVEWAAGREWSTGKVAMWGKSYDAAEGVLAVAARPRGLAAAVIQAPGLSGYTGLWLNRVHYATGRYGTTGVYTADDLGPTQNADSATSPEYAAAFADGLAQPPNCRSEALVGMNTERDRDSAFWKDREPYLLVKGATTPVLWTHGFFDANTKPVHLDVYTALQGETRAWFGQFTHVRGHEPGVGRKGFLAEAMRFLDRHVRGVGTTIADPPVTVQEGSGARTRWRAEERWPPADARTWSAPLVPGAYTDTAGGSDRSTDGAWSATAPLPHAAHLAGEAVVTADINALVPDVNLVAHLYDVSPDGQATLVNRGALAVKGSGEQQAVLRLLPQDHRFDTGHRVALKLSGSDDDWFTPGVSQTPVEVTGGTLALPLLRFRRDATLTGGASDAQQAPFALGVDLAARQMPGPLPEAQVPRPAVSVPARPTAAGTIRRRATLRLRVQGRRLIVRGRASGARRVRLTVRFGGVRVARRTVGVRRGAFGASFVLKRLRAGRLEVVAVPDGGVAGTRGTVRLRSRR